MYRIAINNVAGEIMYAPFYAEPYIDSRGQDKKHWHVAGAASNDKNEAKRAIEQWMRTQQKQ